MLETLTRSETPAPNNVTRLYRWLLPAWIPWRWTHGRQLNGRLMEQIVLLRCYWCETVKYNKPQSLRVSRTRPNALFHQTFGCDLRCYLTRRKYITNASPFSQSGENYARSLRIQWAERNNILTHSLPTQHHFHKGEKSYKAALSKRGYHIILT